MKVHINLNDKVRVKLTEAGLTFVNSPANNTGLTPDAQGYVETELWNLAAVFSALFYNGNPTPPFEGMDVEIVFRSH